MKHLKFLFIGLFALSLSGCDEALFDIVFGLNTADIKFVVEPTAEAGDIILAPTTRKVNLDSLAVANGADINKLKSVKVKKMTAFVDLPAHANFDVFETGEVTIGAVGLPTKIIGKFASMPKGLKQFEIIPEPDVNLLDYARKTEITVTGKLVTNGPVIEPITVRLLMEFEVIANPVN